MAAAAPIGENVVLHPAMHRPVAQPPQQDASGDGRPMTEGTLAVALAPIAPRWEPTVTVEAVRETVTYTLPVSDAALPQALLRAAAERRAHVIDGKVDAPKAHVPTLAALPPPVASGESGVISLPDAAAEHAARAERTAWETAHDAGFSAAQGQALEQAAPDNDDPRTMAMRLAPTKRDG